LKSHPLGIHPAGEPVDHWKRLVFCNLFASIRVHSRFIARLSQLAKKIDAVQEPLKRKCPKDCLRAFRPIRDNLPVKADPNFLPMEIADQDSERGFFGEGIARASQPWFACGTNFLGGASKPTPG